MEYIYRPKGVCSRSIRLELEGDVIRSVQFEGGCHGNLQGIAKLVEGMTADQVEQKLSGIKCGMRKTSCPDQLAQAVRKAMEQSEDTQENQAG
nr:TIGR03905 family TSCPD domain-containing protein [uncultured Solibaculum sp.]